MLNYQSIIKSRGQKTFFMFILTLLFLLLTACGQAPASTPTLANMKGKIVFVSDQNGNKDIYSIDTNGQNLKQLTTNNSDDYAPKWSPDGKKIVFVSERNSHISVLYTMNADGSNQTRLNINANDIPSHPEWLPDGKKIAFATNTQHLFILNLETGSQTELGSNIDPLSLSWSPDGKKVAFVYYSLLNLIFNGIAIINGDGTGETELNPKGYDFNGLPSGVSWSPDGTKIAFGKLRIDYTSKMPDEITYIPITFTMRPDGSDVHQITDKCAGGEWSPDSQWIVCASRDNEKKSLLYGLYIVNVANGNFFRLTNTPYTQSNPDWSPNP